MTRRIWALVLASRRAGSLDEVLVALAGQTRLPDGVLIVDSEATVEVRGVIDEHRRAGAEVLELGFNGGSAGGFAAGLDALAGRSGVDAVVCFDDDAVPTERCLETLEEAWGRESAAGAVGAASQTPDGTLAWPLWVEGRTQVRTAGALRAAADGRSEVPVAELAWHALLIPTETVRRIGPPRPELFQWYEDVEWGLRVNAAGLQLLVCPDAVVHHPPPPKATRVRLPLVTLDVPRTTPARTYLMIRNSLTVRHAYMGRRFWVIDLPLLMINAAVAVARLPRPLWSARHVLGRAVLDAVRGRLGPPPSELGA